MNDPFFLSILGKLERPLNPDVFEACACDLLAPYVPGLLVPVLGGGDAGFDGAIGDGASEPCPLVCTTEADVIGNLTKSLDAVRASGSPATRVLVATSQKLNAGRQQNLRERAREKGFTLVHLVERAGLANLLYRSSRWCRELLDLTGEPSALSRVPLRGPGLLGGELVGRADDLSWLKDQEGDILLLGHPGSGKTRLGEALAGDNAALFVTTQDPAAIANAVRDVSPAALIVDDAHASPAMLDAVLRVRADTGASYRIVAMAWPNARAHLQATLRIPTSSVRDLRLLTRAEMVEVVHAVGIERPIQLVAEIVSQAEGRPGLAVSLALWWLSGDRAEVARGDSLYTALMPGLRKYLGDIAAPVIAAFAIGGDVGMPIDVVAAELGIPVAQLQLIVNGLIEAASLRESDSKRLVVSPPALGSILIRDVFFAGAASIPVDGLVRRAPSGSAAVLALVRARRAGAPIPSRYLLEQLEAAGSAAAWTELAWSDGEAAEYIVNTYPALVTVVAPAALHHVPEASIPRLLAAAALDKRPTNSNPDHPIRQLEDWALPTGISTAEAERRRELLVEYGLAWLLGGGEQRIAFEAFRIALAPELSSSSLDPGPGDVVTIHFAILHPTVFPAIERLWAKILEGMDGRTASLESWGVLWRVVQAWLHPHMRGGQVGDTFLTELQRIGLTMLEGCRLLGRGRPGVQRRVAAEARHVGIEIVVPTEPDFETLYPDWDEIEPTAWPTTPWKELAGIWSTQQPGVVCQRLLWLQEEADAAGHQWPSFAESAAGAIAELVTERLPWVAEFRHAGQRLHFLTPFLRRAIESREVGWEAELQDCLAADLTRDYAVMAVLSATDAPEEALRRAVDQADERLAHWIELSILRGELTGPAVAAILESQNPTVALGAAVGLRGTKNDPPDPAVRTPAFRRAILRSLDDTGPFRYELGQILASDPGLAHDWLLQWLKVTPIAWFDDHGPVKEAVAGLDTAARACIVRRAVGRHASPSLVGELIGSDIGAYSALLADPELEPIWLMPLAGGPERPTWIPFVSAALKHGIAPRDIIQASYRPGLDLEMIAGPQSAHWRRREAVLQAINCDGNPLLARTVDLGLELVCARIASALAEEASKAVYGD